MDHIGESDPMILHALSQMKKQTLSLVKFNGSSKCYTLITVFFFGYYSKSRHAKAS